MTTLATVSAGAGADTVINQNLDAVSPAGLYGRRAAGTSGLTWAYFGGIGFGNAIVDGTVTLTASSTNYVVANKSTGAVSVSTSNTNWNDSTNYFRLYLIVTGASTVTTATDYREVFQNAAGGGGGLTNFTESLNTASPNSSINATRLLVTTGSADNDFVLQAKGAGSLLAQLPDSATSGGNKRGTRAVDWQMNRSAAASVASGQYSVIGGGFNNTASAQGATVAGGENNAATVADATVAGGASNAATSNYAFVGGGFSNTASGQYSVSMGRNNVANTTNATALGGENNTASGAHSVVFGMNCTSSGQFSMASGQYAITRSLIGARAYAADRNSATGDAQGLRMVLRGTTTDATPKVLTANNAAAGSTNMLILANSQAASVTGKVTVRDSSGNTAGWTFSCLIKRGANAASTSIVGTATVTSLGADVGASSWILGVSADTTNGGLAVTFTGAAATNCRVVCVLDDAENTY